MGDLGDVEAGDGTSVLAGIRLGVGEVGGDGDNGGGDLEAAMTSLACHKTIAEISSGPAGGSVRLEYNER